MEAASARYAAKDRFGPTFTEPAQTPLQRYIRMTGHERCLCRYRADRYSRECGRPAELRAQSSPQSRDIRSYKLEEGQCVREVRLSHRYEADTVLDPEKQR